MNREQQIKAIARLLEETCQTHQRSFRHSNGVDPDSAIWYAKYLAMALPYALGVSLTRTQLVCLLSTLDSEAANTRGDQEPWSEFYARELASRYLAEPGERLVLYAIPGCPYCQRVLNVVERWNIDVKVVDVFENACAREDLLAARGRATVPVLRCISTSDERWMPDSGDIARHLEHRFGRRAAPRRGAAQPISSP